MAWMNDYEYDFVTDSANKKNIARSARSTRTHCGKRGAVKLPSDYMTKKELKAMNGNVINYKSLKGPMSWEDFKELPDDLKKEYIRSIRDRFGAPDKSIAEMLGVSGGRFGLYVRDLGLGLGKDNGNGRRKWNKEEFLAWSHGADLNVAVPVVTETEAETKNNEEAYAEEIIETLQETGKPSNVMSDNENQSFSCEVRATVPYYGNLSFKGPADESLNMLRMILGNKNVELSVVWKAIEEVTPDA